MSRPFARALLLAALPAAALAAGDTVGPEACKACHPAAYEAWRASPHARAADVLPERSRKDERCLGCHAPGAADGLAGVSCEACHGPGRMYAAAYVMRDRELARAVGLADPGAKTCLACHTDSTPSLVPFDHARKLPLIDHWTAERAAAAARRGKPPAATKGPPGPSPRAVPSPTPPARPAR